MATLAFTLMLRLPDDHAPDLGSGSWTHWRYAAAVVPQGEYGDPHDDPPYKRYPGTRRYFSAPALEALFPSRDRTGRSGRWIRRPLAWSIVADAGDGDGVVLNVDLLEVVRVQLAPHVTFGIVHLSVDRQLTGDEMLGVSRTLSTRYRPADRKTPRLVVFKGSERDELHGTEPLRSLTSALFGAAHEFVALRAYIFAAAQLPDDVNSEGVAIWRRALGQGRRGERDHPTTAERDRRRTERFGAAEATFFGRSAALTYQDDVAGALRNLRSYWAETVLLGLIQHAYVEHYAMRLSELGGAPVSEPIERLYREWLRFRNVLWWQHPSFTTDIANHVLRHTHNGLDTRSLYAELESAFATYVEARRHDAEADEARALRALQMYGAGFATVGSVAAMMQVAGESYLNTATARVGGIAFLLLLGVLAVVGAGALLRRRGAEN